jgi:ribosomal protein L19
MAKTVREQIAAVEAQIAKLNEKKTELTAKLGDEVNPAELVSGAQVVFSYGKGTTVRELTGVITGVKLADPAVAKSSTLLRIAAGEGFDAQIVTVYPAAVKRIVGVAAAE